MIDKISTSEKLADKLTTFLGSWNFIIFQLLIILMWITLNVTKVIQVDEFPFVFLNLALSFQAAFTAPVILMSQNKQARRDRLVQQTDFQTDRKAENEISFIIEELKELKSLLKNRL